MTDAQRLDEETVRRLRDELLEEALPVRFAHPVPFLIQGQRQDWPVVLVDARARPDVADLCRVARAEGSIQSRGHPPFRYLFVDGHGYMELASTITDPVNCAFKFALVWPRYWAMFTLMLRRGALLFTTDNVEDALDHGITMKINQVEIRYVLANWLVLRDASPDQG